MRIAIPVSAPSVVANPMPLMIAAFCLLWSSAFAVAKIALADCPPLFLLAARFLLAGVVILGGAVIWRSGWRLSWRDLLSFALLGALNNALYLGLSYSGMHTVSAGLTALIISANPVLTALLAAGFLGEQMTWRKAAGLLLGVIGVAFVVESRVGSGIDGLSGLLFIGGALVS